MRHLVAALVALAMYVGTCGGAAHAQGGMIAEIAQVNTGKYPDVTVYVQVVDAAGQPVGGLTQGQFSLTEDGAPVEIVSFSLGGRASIATVLTIDHSSSMGVESKLTGAKEAARTFVDEMRGQDQVAVVAFDSKVATVQPFTSDKVTLRRAIDGIELGNCTAWYDGIYDSVSLITPLQGRRSVVLLSDGIDCREDPERRQLGLGSRHTLDEAIAAARKAEIPVYAIGLGAQISTEVGLEGYDEAKLSRSARESGGKYFHSPGAAELKALYRQLSEEMQKEYVVTYRSPRPHYDGTRRNIGVTVSTRAGPVVTARPKAYTEQHLLNLSASFLIFLAFLAPLALLLLVPLVPQWGVRLPRRQPAAMPPALPDAAPGPGVQRNQGSVNVVAPKIPQPPPPFAGGRTPVTPTAETSPAPSGVTPGAMHAVPLAAGVPTLLVVRYALEPVPFTVGHGPGNTVILSDPAAAAAHAVIERQGDRYVIRDLSGGQTFMSYRGDPAQERPAAENALRIGSTVRCGQARFVVGGFEGVPGWLEQATSLQPLLTLGAAATNVIRLTGPGVAPVHLQVTCEQDRWVVEDLSGGLGLQISYTGNPGQMRPVTARNAVKAGSLLRIGQGPRSVLIEFRAA